MPQHKIVTTEYPKGFDADAFLDLIAEGSTETAALQTLGFSRSIYMLMRIRHEEFNQRLAEATKQRANIWYEKIAKTADDILDAKEVPSSKLQFEKLKYLAEKDDPDRFGDKKKIESTLSMTIMDFRNMSNKEAQQILTSNPFANVIDAEFTPVSADEPDEDEEDLDAL